MFERRNRRNSVPGAMLLLLTFASFRVPNVYITYSFQLNTWLLYLIQPVESSGDGAQNSSKWNRDKSFSSLLLNFGQRCLIANTFSKVTYCLYLKLSTWLTLNDVLCFYTPSQIHSSLGEDDVQDSLEEKNSQKFEGGRTCKAQKTWAGNQGTFIVIKSLLPALLCVNSRAH